MSTKVQPAAPDAFDFGSNGAAVKQIEQTAKRGLAAAREQELANRQAELAQSIEDLAKNKRGRGNKQANYDAYNRTYARLERLAAAVASTTGKPVSIPEYDPPPLEGATKMTVVNPPAFDIKAEQYRETGGKGPSGKGLPTAAPIPGTGQGNGKGEWV